MSTLETYLTLQRLTPTPTGAGGVALNSNFTVIADALAALNTASHTPVTIGTASGLSLSTQVLSLALATTGTAGAMSAADKTKLDGVATAATANSSDATLLARANHTGTQSADSITDGTTNKAYTAVEKTKLSGIATAATANSSDATLLDRANHTGTQAIATVTSLQATLDAKLAKSGGTMTGAIDMGSNYIANVSNITANQISATGATLYIDSATDFGGHAAGNVGALTAVSGVFTSDVSVYGDLIADTLGGGLFTDNIAGVSGTAITVAGNFTSAQATLNFDSGELAAVTVTATEMFPDSVEVASGLTLYDSANVSLGTTTGTKIGTATTQKLGFYNATPVVQQSATADIKDALTAYGFIAGASPTPLNLDGGTLTAGTVSATTYSGAGTSALLARANHTGTQAISTITSLQATLDAKVATGSAGALSSLTTSTIGTTGGVGTLQFNADQLDCPAISASSLIVGGLEVFDDAEGNPTLFATDGVLSLDGVLVGVWGGSAYAPLVIGAGGLAFESSGSAATGKITSPSNVFSIDFDTYSIASGNGDLVLDFDNCVLTAADATIKSQMVFNESANIYTGTTTGTKIAALTTQKLGFWGATPIVQPASASQASVATTSATNTTPYGFTTSAQANAIVTLVNELRAAMVAAGLIKGSA